MMLRPGATSAGFLLALLAACSTVPAPSPPPVMPVVTAPPQISAPQPVVAPAPPPAPTMSGHVASYKTLPEAEAAWPRLLNRFPLLKDQPKRFVEIDLGGQRGKVVRLLVGDFVDRDHASQFCHKLRGTGAFCAPHDLPANNPGSSAS